MKKVLAYSVLLIAGLVASQLLRGGAAIVVTPLTMVALAFIMIHVGYEFEIDKSKPRQYAWDYLVAATAATFPWIFCVIYFVAVMRVSFRGALLEGLFASPTSAGVLFSMLAAAGLAATWVFKKARILAIFDDLNTIILLIPLKAMMIGLRGQLIAVAIITIGLLYVAWRYLRTLRWPVTWPWVLTYATAIVLLSETVTLVTRRIDPTEPIHIEVLLPAFALGCMLRVPAGQDPHCDDALEGHEEGPEMPNEQRVATIVSACFMLLVGLSMPSVTASRAGDGASAVTAFPGWGVIALHVIVITLLSNLGKMFPALCYRREATMRERIALAISMFPRGEVGAGVLVIALSYRLAGPSLTVAVLSLAVNLACTGIFILIVKRLLAASPSPSAPSGK